MVTIPGIVIAYMSMKMPQYVKPVGLIFIFAIGLGITVFFGFGILGPTGYLLPEIEEVTEEISEIIEPTSPIFAISILAGSANQGAPDYGPDNALVEQGYVMEWVNDDEVTHTVTSSLDFGETFDSGLINAGDTFQIDTGNLALGAYEYMCIVHPWMIATFVVEEPKGSVVEIINIPNAVSYTHLTLPTILLV